MKILVFAILAGIAMPAWSSPSLDCSFDGKRPFCKWKREWYGMRRAGWRSGKRMRNNPLEDHTSRHGKFVYFLARSRPTGFRSRFRSPAVVPSGNTCFTFWLAMGGVKRPFPDGNSVLRIYMVGERSPVEAATPIWTKGEKTPQDHQFHKIVVPLDDSLQTLSGAPVQFVVETIRGGSKKSFVAIDDVTLESCDETNISEPLKEENNDKEATLKRNDVRDKLTSFMLAAHRPKAKVMTFRDFLSSAAQTIDATSDSLPSRREHGVTGPSVRILTSKKGRKGRRKGRSQRRKKRTRKNRRNRKNKSSFRRNNIVGYVTSAASQSFDPAENSRLGQTATPNVLDTSNAAHSAPHTCDFIEYTQRLHRCFRTFFSTLRKHPRTCSVRYLSLEECVRISATSCVQSRDLDAMRVEEIVVGTLRNNFKTERVFCEEEGAFVFPKFALKQVPIQCGKRYFIKLSECSGSFSSMFHIQHGDPQLCREYYRANECQRQTTAQECNFDTETMLLYGLNLQYQFAHNPFCIDLPFSSWWPES